MIRRGDRDRIRNHDISLIPSSGHSATEGVEEALSFFSDALSAARLRLVRFRDGGSFAGLESADIERVNLGQHVRERGAVGREGRGEGEELEGLDSGDGDYVVGTGEGFLVGGGWVGVYGDEVGDRTGCEEGSFYGYGGWVGGGDADAVRGISFRGRQKREGEGGELPRTDCAAQSHLQRHHGGGHSWGRGGSLVVEFMAMTLSLCHVPHRGWDVIDMALMNRITSRRTERQSRTNQNIRRGLLQARTVGRTKPDSKLQ